MDRNIDLLLAAEPSWTSCLPSLGSRVSVRDGFIVSNRILDPKQKMNLLAPTCSGPRLMASSAA